MSWTTNEVPELDHIVRSLAENVLQHGISVEFRQQAKDLSQDIAIDQLNELKRLLHSPPRESDLYRPASHGYGGWLSFCQFAIFELIYNLGEAALPFVREAAWGEYDWTQGNAIELLIRFAADGIRKNEIIEEIKTNYPNIRYEAQLYALEPLVHEVEKNQNLKDVFQELMAIKDFKRSYDELIDTEA